jgi:DNA repair exonuclease SbcCD ATPase subunit
VRLANDTVQNLSDGDLTIELDDGGDGGDGAFALRIRQGDDPAPIGVSYLSGSQKFRVAVSVALAIGRFAAGQARPLESVIIDEGFGSLDRDGLRAAADELNRLRQHLRRIVQ